MSFWIRVGGVTGAFMRNISNHSNLANGSARKDVGSQENVAATRIKLGRHVASID